MGVVVAACQIAGYCSHSFVPAAVVAEKAGHRLELSTATAAALATAAAAPLPVAALAEDDDEGFDLRILAILALPLTAISWALFNVWRVAFRQGQRLGSASGSSKQGLRIQD